MLSKKRRDIGVEEDEEERRKLQWRWKLLSTSLRSEGSGVAEIARASSHRNKE